MPLRMKRTTNSAEHTQAIGAALAQRLHAGDLITLEGDLGAGKTVFVRGLAEGLGLNPSHVSSPTFIIRQEYASRDGSRTLVHIDAYRISGPDELETIGWSDLLNEPDIFIAIEWPSRIERALPERRIQVAIDHLDATEREITITAPESLADRLSGLSDIEVQAPAQEARPARCRRCGVAITTATPTFPFCSDRCRLADLGRWFNEGYRVSRPIQADDELDD